MYEYKGMGLVTYTDSLKTQVIGDLMHAQLPSNRISELGDEARSDPSEWKTLSNISSLHPTYHVTLRSVLEKGLEFEGKAVENYNSLLFSECFS
ncbi:MAG: hypothetical protein AUI60_01340 [Thaumarchaeota archaeon 13_1_40CM_2_39_4]|nr:MAG: hypothetical protein AUI60_01340 [Thaumarchaeota archaeon 13_1_40CM_2_39_4]